MKKITLLLLAIISFSGFAQDKTYDTEYFRCENKWVLLPNKENDTINNFGFIYLDRSAGFTYDHGGSYYIKDGKEMIVSIQPVTNRIMHRLEPNTVRMQIMPDNIREQLKLPKEPVWLSTYREGEDDTDALVKRGWHFNHVGGSDIAIPLLEKAYLREPHAEGLEFELSYAYNAAERYDEAVKVLDKAIKNDPKNFWFLRELGYSYVHVDKLDQAEKTYKKGIAMSDNKVQQAEMAFNMAGAYYRKTNRKKFDEWLKVAKQYAEKDSPYYKPLEELEATFGKK